MEKITGKAAKLLLAVVAMFAVTMAGTQTATAAPANGVAAAVAPAAAASSTTAKLPYYVVCTAPTYYSNAVVRDCTVYSGYVRQYIDCSNGFRYWGPWVGVGSWRLTNICPSPYYRTGSGLQFTG
jgi:hypothetical protein